MSHINLIQASSLQDTQNSQNANYQKWDDEFFIINQTSLNAFEFSLGTNTVPTGIRK